MRPENYNAKKRNLENLNEKNHFHKSYNLEKKTEFGKN